MLPLAHGMIPLARGLPPRQIPWRGQFQSIARRRCQKYRSICQASAAEPHRAGHIEKSQNETLIFISSVLPVHLGWLSRIPYVNLNAMVLQRLEKLGVRGAELTGSPTVVEQVLPDELLPNITQVIPRLTEGGAFVKLSHGPETSGSDIIKTITQRLYENPVKPWFSLFSPASAALVRGRPWVEDLSYRFPSSRVKVEFLPVSPDAPAAELTQENLYSLARTYGKLTDIIPQPADSKVVPRYALLDFSNPVSAVMAKNCLHGFKVPSGDIGGKAGTILQFSYERKIKAHWIRDWLFSHPRIVLPILVAILAGITVAIFDPIRTFFIRLKISPPLQFQDNRLWTWLQRQATKANSLFSLHRGQYESKGLNEIWEERKEDAQQIQNWLVEGNDTFIVVHGPRGLGKKEFVLDEALKNYKNKLVIDCKPIQEAPGDSTMIAAAAAEVGYKPVFSWMNSISSVIDVATQSAIGTKAGFSETLDTQLGNILQNTAKALKKVALDGRKKGDKDGHLSDDEWLEANPARRPVVIIDNFLHKSKDNQMVYDKLAEWAAALIYTNIAHVLFLTSDLSYSKTLSQALPNQVFHQVSFTDCKPEVAKRFVLSHVSGHEDSKSLDYFDEKFNQELTECIKRLGGRLTDLEFFARMIARGLTPNNAVQQIVHQSAAEILKIFITEVDPSSRGWTPEQAWYLIKNLGTAKAQTGNHNGSDASEEASIRYSDIILSELFKKDGEATLRALEKAELISVISKNGRPSIIKPGKPVLAAAFRQLVEDKVLSSRLDLRILGQMITIQNQAINKIEDELKVLGTFPKEPSEARRRIKWLLANLALNQAKIDQYEMESAQLKLVLKTEF
ncbi:RNA12 protein [Trichophyton equinum CBS 127.97]|uniref:Mitochondrial escape protein 2 n=1 Tax=Trichophyton equinum (strain ATCC MYA-4606 / CBS 127.97) TaxID=559882 RepID=F2PZL1_TRIEC|nr:RNA12 protein [Trichophyton equinum CBS 127.97]